MKDRKARGSGKLSVEKIVHRTTVSAVVRHYFMFTQYEINLLAVISLTINLIQAGVRLQLLVN